MYISRRRNDSEAYRMTNQLAAGSRTQLLLDRRLVVGDGLGGDTQLVRDFREGEALRKQFENLEFPRGEHGGGCRVARGNPQRQSLRDIVTEVVLAASDGVDGFH